MFVVVELWIPCTRGHASAGPGAGCALGDEALVMPGARFGMSAPR